MNKLMIVLASIFLGSVAYGQAWTGGGDQKLQAGLSGWGYGKGITATYDYGVGNFVSLGGGINLYFDDSKDKNMFLFGRVNAHLQEVINMPDQWDVYTGLDIGILGGTFGLGAHLGARYFFNQKFGAFLELGNNGSVGVSINL